MNNNTATNWTQADHTIIAESQRQNAPSAAIVQRLEAKLHGKRFKSSTASPDGSTRQSDRTEIGATLRRRTNCTQGGWFYIPPERRAELIVKDDAKQKLSPSRLDATDARWEVLKQEKTQLCAWTGTPRLDQCAVVPKVPVVSVSETAHIGFHDDYCKNPDCNTLHSDFPDREHVITGDVNPERTQEPKTCGASVKKRCECLRTLIDASGTAFPDISDLYNTAETIKAVSPYLAEEFVGGLRFNSYVERSVACGVLPSDCPDSALLLLKRRAWAQKLEGVPEPKPVLLTDDKYSREEWLQRTNQRTADKSIDRPLHAATGYTKRAQRPRDSRFVVYGKPKKAAKEFVKSQSSRRDAPENTWYRQVSVNNLRTPSELSRVEPVYGYIRLYHSGEGNESIQDVWREPRECEAVNRDVDDFGYTDIHTTSPGLWAAHCTVVWGSTWVGHVPIHCWARPTDHVQYEHGQLHRLALEKESEITICAGLPIRRLHSAPFKKEYLSKWRSGEIEPLRRAETEETVSEQAVRLTSQGELGKALRFLKCAESTIKDKGKGANIQSPQRMRNGSWMIRVKGTDGKARQLAIVSAGGLVKKGRSDNKGRVVEMLKWTMAHEHCILMARSKNSDVEIREWNVKAFICGLAKGTKDNPKITFASNYDPTPPASRNDVMSLGKGLRTSYVDGWFMPHEEFNPTTDDLKQPLVGPAKLFGKQKNKL